MQPGHMGLKPGRTGLQPLAQKPGCAQVSTRFEGSHSFLRRRALRCWLSGRRSCTNSSTLLNLPPSCRASSSCCWRRETAPLPHIEREGGRCCAKPKESSVHSIAVANSQVCSLSVFSERPAPPYHGTTARPDPKLITTTLTPPRPSPFAAAADVRDERAPRVRGVHEGPLSTLGVHVAHFRPMCLTHRVYTGTACAAPRALLCPARTPRFEGPHVEPRLSKRSYHII